VRIFQSWKIHRSVKPLYKLHTNFMTLLTCSVLFCR